jgi:hypothetical protein
VRLQPVVRDFFRNFDCSATTDFEFGRFAPSFINVPGSATTSGSSTTVTEGVSGNAFALAIGVGDELYVRSAGDRVLVTAKASNASITISEAKDWSSVVNLQVRKFSSGQGASDGWIPCAGLINKVVHLEVATLASTSAQFCIETRSSGMNSSRVLTPAAFSAVTVSSTNGSSSFADIAIPEGCEAIRVGVIVVSNGTDVVSAHLYGEQYA